MTEERISSRDISVWGEDDPRSSEIVEFLWVIELVIVVIRLQMMPLDELLWLIVVNLKDMGFLIMSDSCSVLSECDYFTFTGDLEVLSTV